MDLKLIGIWQSDLSDEATNNIVGDVLIEFTNDGKLIYKIFENDKVQIVNMIYHILDGVIFSDQPSNPNIQETKYKFLSDNKLVLDFEDELTIFKKTT